MKVNQKIISNYFNYANKKLLRKTFTKNDTFDTFANGMAIFGAATGAAYFGYQESKNPNGDAATSVFHTGFGAVAGALVGFTAHVSVPVVGTMGIITKVASINRDRHQKAQQLERLQQKYARDMKYAESYANYFKNKLGDDIEHCYRYGLEYYINEQKVYPRYPHY